MGRAGRWVIVVVVGVGVVGRAIVALGADAEAVGPAIPVAKIERAGAVDFESEVLPALRSSCLACHNRTRAKAGLILETPADILRGGENGPVVVPGESGKSLLLASAAHAMKPAMPPKDNKVSAVNLTSEQLGLMRLWIDQGAKGEVKGAAPIQWQAPAAAGVQPIYAVAISGDGQYAAAGRGNQIHLYHVPTQRFVGGLADPRLVSLGAYGAEGAAHREMVESLAFNPEGNLLASGGFGEVKLWRRAGAAAKFSLAVPATQASAAAGARVVATSGDGKWVAVAAGSRVDLFDAVAGKQRRTLAGFVAGVRAMDFSGDGARLAVASGEGDLRVSNVRDGSLAARKGGPAPAEINAVAWVMNGKQIAAGGADGVIRIWQAPENADGEWGAARELKGNAGAVTCLAAMNGGSQLVSGGADGSVRQWNVADGRMVRQVGHGAAVAMVAARGDGKFFASVGEKDGAKLWDATKGTVVSELKGNAIAAREVAARDRAQKLAASDVIYFKAMLQKAEAATKPAAERVKKATDAKVAAEKVVADVGAARAKVAAEKEAADKAVTAVNAEVEQKKVSAEELEKAVKAAQGVLEKLKAEAAKAPTTISSTRPATGPMATTVATMPTTVAATTQKAQKIPATMATTISTTGPTTAATYSGERARSFGVPQDDNLSDEGHRKILEAEIAAKTKETADAKALVAKLAGEQKVKVAAAEEKGKELKKVEEAVKVATQPWVNAENELNLAAVAAKKAGDELAEAKVTLANAEEAQRVADAALAAAQGAANAAIKPARSVAFSADQRTLITCDEQKIHVWMSDGSSLLEAIGGEQPGIAHVNFVGDASVLVTHAAGDLVAWSLGGSWALERTIGSGDSGSALTDRVNALAFSPDGRLLATGSGEPSRSGQVKLWEVKSGNLVGEFKDVHSDSVLALDFSSDGKYLASGAADRFVKVLDVKGMKAIKTFEGHSDHVLGVSWKAGGRTLASCSADKQVKIWDVVSGERRANATGFGKEVTAVRFLGLSDLAIAASGDGQIRIVNEAGAPVRAINGPGGFLHAAGASADGGVIIAGGQGGVLAVWKDPGAGPVASFSAPAAVGGSAR